MFVELVGVLGTMGASHQQRALHLDPFGLALIALGAAMVAIARHWPWVAFTVALATTAAYVTLGYPTDSPHFLGLLVTAYLVPVAGARWRAGIFAVATIVAFAATAPVTRNPASWAWPTLALVTAVALVVGQVTVELNARAEARAARAHEEAARRRLADERLAIARELHDVVSHSIAMINVQAGVAVHVMDERPAQAREALLAIKAASRDAMQDLRAILGLLRDASDPESFAPAPGLAQLSDLIDNIRQAGIQVSFDDAAPGGLPAMIELTVYRVVQEALTNVVRHAPGADARVRVACAEGRLLVEVENGKPRSAAATTDGRFGSGHGLEGMHERVAAAGGQLETLPGPQGGWIVRAWLPVGRSPA